MIGWFVWGAMNLARTIKYAVQARWARIVLFERLLPLTGLRATESGIDPRILVVVIFLLTLVSVASRRVIAILASGVLASLALLLLWASQLSSPAQKRVMSAVRAAMDFGFS